MSIIIVVINGVTVFFVSERVKSTVVSIFLREVCLVVMVVMQIVGFFCEFVDVVVLTGGVVVVLVVDFGVVDVVGTIFARLTVLICTGR